MSIAVALLLSASVVVLFLTVLSLMREVVLLRGEVAGLTQVITIPPAPQVMGQRLPQEILSAITARPAAEQEKQGRADHAVLFLSPGCGGCANLVQDLGSALADGLIDGTSLTAVVLGSSRDLGVEAPLRTHGVAVVPDHDSKLFKACDVRGTPMIIAMWTGSGEAIDYSYGGGAQWILECIHSGVLDERASLLGTRTQTKH